ncbi:unnamed protein product [Effrenium voratum]|nr:unnamed protein product [Effrenium voratum]
MQPESQRHTLSFKMQTTDTSVGLVFARRQVMPRRGAWCLPGFLVGLAFAPHAGVRTALRAKTAEVTGELTPLFDYVLAKSKEAVTSTKSGLLLPSSSEKPSEGEVVAVGPGSVKENGVQVAPWAEAGMKILHGKYGVEEVTYNGEEHVLVRDEDVLLSYEGEPTLESIKMPRGKVLLKLLEKESQGGILLSKGAAKPDTTMGEVVAVGDDDLDRNGKPVPMDIAVGDFVRFRFGNEVKLDLGKSEFRSVSASECLAKWRK